VPAGGPRGGQWTDRSGGQGTGAGPSQDASQSQDADLAQPMGNVDIGDISGSSELGDLFQIKPGGTSTDSAQVADVIRVCTVIGAGQSTVNGIKTYSVTYECFGGKTFRKEGFGHNFPGIVRDPFR
jgi:hypothetical protein